MLLSGANDSSRSVLEPWKVKFTLTSTSPPIFVRCSPVSKVLSLATGTWRHSTGWPRDNVSAKVRFLEPSSTALSTLDYAGEARSSNDRQTLPPSDWESIVHFTSLFLGGISRSALMYRRTRPLQNSSSNDFSLNRIGTSR